MVVKGAHMRDSAEKHEPNEIHPEDYWVCVAYDPSIVASRKGTVAKQ
jgi:hypothetical protein